MENHWSVGLLLLGQRDDIRRLAEQHAEPWNRPVEKTRPLRTISLARLASLDPERESECLPECGPRCAECCCETA